MSDKKEAIVMEAQQGTSGSEGRAALCNLDTRGGSERSAGEFSWESCGEASSLTDPSEVVRDPTILEGANPAEGMHW